MFVKMINVMYVKNQKDNGDVLLCLDAHKAFSVVERYYTLI